MLRSHFIRVVLAGMFMTLLLMAQTADDLRQKYEILSTIETYKVRPNIIATAKYSLNGKLEEMRVEVSPPITDCTKINASK
jgi:hypothetical protein